MLKTIVIPISFYLFSLDVNNTVDKYTQSTLAENIQSFVSFFGWPLNCNCTLEKQRAPDPLCQKTTRIIINLDKLIVWLIYLSQHLKLGSKISHVLTLQCAIGTLSRLITISHLLSTIICLYPDV